MAESRSGNRSKPFFRRLPLAVHIDGQRRAGFRHLQGDRARRDRGPIPARAAGWRRASPPSGRESVLAGAHDQIAHRLAVRADQAEVEARVSGPGQFQENLIPALLQPHLPRVGPARTILHDSPASRSSRSDLAVDPHLGVLRSDLEPNGALAGREDKGREIGGRASAENRRHVGGVGEDVADEAPSLTARGGRARKSPKARAVPPQLGAILPLPQAAIPGSRLRPRRGKGSQGNGPSAARPRGTARRMLLRRDACGQRITPPMLRRRTAGRRQGVPGARSANTFFHEPVRSP